MPTYARMGLEIRKCTWQFCVYKSNKVFNALLDSLRALLKLLEAS